MQSTWGHRHRHEMVQVMEHFKVSHDSFMNHFLLCKRRQEKCLARTAAPPQCPQLLLPPPCGRGTAAGLAHGGRAVLPHALLLTVCLQLLNLKPLLLADLGQPLQLLVLDDLGLFVLLDDHISISTFTGRMYASITLFTCQIHSMMMMRLMVS